MKNMEGMKSITIALFSPFQGFLQHKIFGKSTFWTSFDEPKNRKKLAGSKFAVKQLIAVYIVENEIRVVFL